MGHQEYQVVKGSEITMEWVIKNIRYSEGVGDGHGACHQEYQLVKGLEITMEWVIKNIRK